MAKKFTYFNVNGLGESIRYMLYYSGEKFEDIRYELSSWPIKEIKDSLPYGQFPIYEEGDRKLNQSLAIARYVASQANLLPTDPWDQAVLDAAAFTSNDFWIKIRGFLFESDAAKKEKFMKVDLPENLEYYLSRFEKELKANKGFFGGKLTWADFILVGFIETANLFLGYEIETAYPTIVALMKTVRTLPGVKEYIASRKPYDISTFVKK